MPIDKYGNPVVRSVDQDRKEFIEAAYALFDEWDPSDGNPAMAIWNASIEGPLSRVRDDMKEVLRQAFIEFATGDNLDRLTEPFNERFPEKRSTGKVNVVLDTLPVSPDPYFSVGDLVFKDGSGERYDMVSDIDIADIVDNSPTSIDMDIQVKARNPGKAGNVGAGAITDVEVAGSAQVRWDGNMVSFTNNEPFSGGADSESDSAYATRVKGDKSAIPSSSLNGIIAAIRKVPGVTNQTVIGNPEDIATSRDVLHDGSAATGTASETIDATTPYIAMKITITDYRFIQHFNATLASDSGSELRVRLANDNAGSPDLNDLLSSRFDTNNDQNFIPGGTAENGATWEKGAYPPDETALPITAWLVFTRQAGSCTFDGENVSGDDNVKVSNDGSSWSLSANVDNINVDLIGGIPPHGFRAYVSGSAADEDIAEAIGSNSPGIQTDGLQSATFEAINGQTPTRRWDVPVQVPVVVKVNIDVTDTFTGDADTIRDIIVSHIGGTDTSNQNQPGLEVAGDAKSDRIIRDLLNPAIVTGTDHVTQFRMGLKSSFPTPANLTASEDYAVVPAADDQELIIETVASDIEVNITVI